MKEPHPGELVSLCNYRHFHCFERGSVSEPARKRNHRVELTWQGNIAIPARSSLAAASYLYSVELLLAPVGHHHNKKRLWLEPRIRFTHAYGHQHDSLLPGIILLLCARNPKSLQIVYVPETLNPIVKPKAKVSAFELIFSKEQSFGSAQSRGLESGSESEVMFNAKSDDDIRSKRFGCF